MIIRLNNAVKSLGKTGKICEMRTGFNVGAVSRRAQGKPGNKRNRFHLQAGNFMPDTFYYCIRRVFPVFFCSLGAKF